MFNWFYLFNWLYLANSQPTRMPTRSKVPERATLSAPCGALSLWPLAIGLHGDTTTLVTEWWWRCVSLVFNTLPEDLFPPSRIIGSLGSAPGQGLCEVICQPTHIIGSLGLCISELAQHHNSVLYPQPHCFQPQTHTTRTFSLSGSCPPPRLRANMQPKSFNFALESGGTGQRCIP